MTHLPLKRQAQQMTRLELTVVLTHAVLKRGLPAAPVRE
jgi:hypothetical protein